MNATKTRARFIWDEPAGASSPRGWASIDPLDHPDLPNTDLPAWEYFVSNGNLTSGFYLTYDADCAGLPKGQTVLWVSYFRACSKWGGASKTEIGSGYTATQDEAKAAIEASICGFLEKNYPAA